MGETGGKSTDRRERYRRKWSEPKPVFPELPYPAGASVTVKQIGYLAVHCRIPPADIVARYHRGLTLSQLHLGLSHYYADQKAIDAELAKDAAFNRPDSLAGYAIPLPSRAAFAEPAKVGPVKAAASPVSDEVKEGKGNGPTVNRVPWWARGASWLTSPRKAPGPE